MHPKAKAILEEITSGHKKNKEDIDPAQALEDVEDFINYDLTHDDDEDDTSDEDFEMKNNVAIKKQNNSNSEKNPGAKTRSSVTKIKEEGPEEDEEDETKEYQCYYCGTMIISVKNVKEHMKEKHRRFHR
jgi:hypothetical protein